MLTAISGTNLQANPWQSFKFEKVLQYFDGPRLLLLKSNADQLYLAWWNDSDDEMERWVYLPISESRLRSVLSGFTPSLEALQNPEDKYLLVVDRTHDSGDVINVTLTTAEHIPEDSMPLPAARISVSLPDEIAPITSRERSHILDIRIDAEVHDPTRRIGAQTVGAFILNLQRLLDSLGQVVLGSPTARGLIPDSVKAKTRLDIVRVYSGSLGVIFESNEDDDMFGESTMKRSLQALYELLETGSALDGLTQQFDQLRSRVAKNYGDLLTTVETFIPSVSMRWSQAHSGSSRGITISQESARSIKAQLQAATSQTQDIVELRGRLIAASSRTLRFEIETTDDGDRIVGTIDPGIVSESRFVIDSHVRAVLIPHLDVNEATGDEKISYTMIDLETLA